MTPARAGTSAVAAVLGAAVLMLVLVTWAASIGTDRVLGRAGVDAGTTPSGPDAEPSPQDGRPSDDLDLEPRSGTPPPFEWLDALAWALRVMVALAALWLLYRILRRVLAWWRGREHGERTEPVDAEFEVLDPEGEVAATMGDDADAQRALLEEGEPRNAIVACWRRFELQAARASVLRRPWETSSEFVLWVLDRAGADQGAVLRLAELFREARYSDHPITEEHRAEALGCLATIHRTLGPATAGAGAARRVR